jgi:hypothetical protein
MTKKAIQNLWVFAVAIGWSTSLHSQTLLNVKIGTTTQDASADGAYVEVAGAVLGSGNSYWNEYAFVSSTPSLVSVVDSTGSTISGVTLTVQNSTGVGSLSTSGNPSFLMNTMPYQNPGGVFNITLAGLAADSLYEFVGYAANPTYSAGATWTVTTGTFQSGAASNDGSSADITTGVGKAYSDFFVKTDASGNLAITDASASGTYPILQGFQLQVAPTPEPSTIALTMVGLGLLLGPALRRRKQIA